MKIPVVFWNVEPIKFINFGLFAAIGSTLGYSISYFYLFTRGFPIGQYCWEMAIIFVFFNLFFAKFYSIFSVGFSSYFKNFRKNANETTFYLQGGIIGFILGAFLIYFLIDIPFSLLGDTVCIGGIVTMSVGRIGCHNYGCCTGKPTKGRFSVTYTDPNAKICRDNPGMMNIPLFPAQLVASAIDFLIFSLCIYVIIEYPVSGLIMVIFIIGINLKRIIIQRFRLEPENNKIPYRWVAFGIIVSIGLIIWLFHTNGETFFEHYPAGTPFAFLNYFRFLANDLKVVSSLIFVGIMNFAAYGINGRNVGQYCNLSTWCSILSQLKNKNQHVIIYIKLLSLQEFFVFLSSLKLTLWTDQMV